jgi:hypothetical protein
MILHLRISQYSSCAPDLNIRQATVSRRHSFAPSVAIVTRSSRAVSTL